jgi:hypothetical protein
VACSFRVVLWLDTASISANQLAPEAIATIGSFVAIYPKKTIIIAAGNKYQNSELRGPGSLAHLSACHLTSSRFNISAITSAGSSILADIFTSLI